LVVGGFNTLVGYGTFAVLNYELTDVIPYAYMVASVLSSVFAITVAFVGYKYVVFRTKGNLLREYLRTYVVYGMSTLVGLALLPLFVFLLGHVIARPRAVPYVAQALATVIVVAGSFMGHKKYSFRS
jgi:putative flippase GtrA